MYRSIFYSIYKDRDMPLTLSFVTYWRKTDITISQFIGLCFLSSTFIISLASCGALSWHSIEQTPALPIAYLKDGVFVSGDYVRSTSIAEIDGKAIHISSNHLVEVSVGIHQVKVFCDEAEGEFNSEEFSGEAKMLEFEAQTQRTYVIRCVPYTHWWIEDLENKSVVAGDKYN